MTTALAATVLASSFAVPGIATAHPDQHGPLDGHLIGTGSFGDLELIGRADLVDQDDLVADVAIDPRTTFAYLAHWGKPTCDANRENGDPDAGTFVVDIADLENPRQIGFIPHSQDSRPGEGMQALNISTKHFNGVMLVMNNEHCGKNGKGGISLYDVSNPSKPNKLSEHFGDRGVRSDFNDIHSAFAWDTGANAFAVMTDNAEGTDVDILNITNPKRPRLIADLNLNAMSAALGDPVFQPELGLDQSFLHDMVVKKIDGHWVMLLSYWDGGYIQLNVDDPASPTLIGDTDYPAVDPELLESAGISLPPEGNGHQSEFTADNKFTLGTDEDFSPYRLLFTITTGANAGEFPAGEFGWTVPVTTLPDQRLNGPTVYGGYGCPADRASIPPADTALPSVGAGEERILVLQRGPVQDPAAPGGACFFSEKVETAQLLGYDGVVIANHHVGAQAGVAADAKICGSQGHAFTPTIPAACAGHRSLHLLFNSTPDYSVPYVAGTEPAVGTLGERVNFESAFDGWGYVTLFGRESRATLDTYAIDEAHDPAFAFGFGDLTVHEVATDPNDAGRAYLAYYSGGVRAIEISCADPADESTCELVETGGYLSEQGNDFWGIEAFTRDGKTYAAASDRDDGLYLFATEAP